MRIETPNSFLLADKSHISMFGLLQLAVIANQADNWDLKSLHVGHMGDLFGKLTKGPRASWVTEFNTCSPSFTRLSTSLSLHRQDISQTQTPEGGSEGNRCVCSNVCVCVSMWRDMEGRTQALKKRWLFVCISEDLSRLKSLQTRQHFHFIRSVWLLNRLPTQFLSLFSLSFISSHSCCIWNQALNSFFWNMRSKLLDSRKFRIFGPKPRNVIYARHSLLPPPSVQIHPIWPQISSPT